MAEENLTFASYRMDRAKNTPTVYDARLFGPAPDRPGRLLVGEQPSKWAGWMLLTCVALVVLGVIVYKLRSKPGAA